MQALSSVCGSAFPAMLKGSPTPLGPLTHESFMGELCVVAHIPEKYGVFDRFPPKQQGEGEGGTMAGVVGRRGAVAEGHALVST